MGKKKDKARRKAAERRHDAMRFTMPPQVAGIAAAALEQVNTPAFRQMIVGALGAAAQAFDHRRPGAQPATPPEPASPAPPACEPRFEMPGINLSPEAARAIDQAASQATKAVENAATLAAQAIGSAAAALDRWAARQTPTTPSNADGRPAP